MPRRRKPAPASAVFINCPFDDPYRPIRRAITFAVLACGYDPRSASDATDGGQSRIDKIAQLIGCCDRGIHDLSRVEVEESDADGLLPRFNMPMELGIHIGARLLGDIGQRRKIALILDAVPHRYDKTLSDISGQDIEAHGNDPCAALGAVRNWLNEHHRRKMPIPGADFLWCEFQAFEIEVPAILEASRLDPYEKLKHLDFVLTVEAWLKARAAA